VAIIVPIIAAAPGYFTAQLSFGELMMVVGAFSQVQSALRYLVDNFPKVADWRSAAHRLSMFRRAMQDESGANESETVQVEIHSEGQLSFAHLSVSLSDGTKLIADATGEIRRGERVLITGVSGCGKTTLFRVIAGLWPWCSGVIKRPPAEEQMFLPQRPYLPLGSLRAAVCYPCRPETLEDEHVRAALKRCGLGDLIQKLDAVDRWDKKLSLGQQQRIAFARLLLQRPKWVLMDEATSALDDDSQASMLSLFDAELAATTVISIAHRPGVEAFHDRTLHLGSTPGGARLVGKSDDDRHPDSSMQHGDGRRKSSSELTRCLSRHEFRCVP
jgi:putative ATP-binding cassette transporter